MSKTKTLIEYADANHTFKTNPTERKFAKNGLRRAGRISSKKELREQFAEWEEEINEQLSLIQAEAKYHEDRLAEEYDPDMLDANDRLFKEFTRELGELTPFELVCSESLYPDDADYEW